MVLLICLFIYFLHLPFWSDRGNDTVYRGLIRSVKQIFKEWRHKHFFSYRHSTSQAHLNLNISLSHLYTSSSILLLLFFALRNFGAFTLTVNTVIFLIEFNSFWYQSRLIIFRSIKICCCPYFDLCRNDFTLFFCFRLGLFWRYFSKHLFCVLKSVTFSRHIGD